MPDHGKKKKVSIQPSPLQELQFTVSLVWNPLIWIDYAYSVCHSTEVALTEPPTILTNYPSVPSHHLD